VFVHGESEPSTTASPVIWIGALKFTDFHSPIVTISLLTKPPGVAPDLASAIALAALAGIAGPNC